MEAGVIVMDGATNWCYWGMRVDGRMEKRQMGNGGTLERERERELRAPKQNHSYCV